MTVDLRPERPAYLNKILEIPIQSLVFGTDICYLCLHMRLEILRVTAIEILKNVLRSICRLHGRLEFFGLLVELTWVEFLFQLRNLALQLRNASSGAPMGFTCGFGCLFGLFNSFISTSELSVQVLVSIVEGILESPSNRSMKVLEHIH